MPVSQRVVALSENVLNNTAQDDLTQIVNIAAGVLAIENAIEVSGTPKARLPPAVERIHDRGRNLITIAGTKSL